MDSSDRWVLPTVLSVSVLNVALNTLVFLLSYLAGLIAAWGIRNLLLLRLKKHGTAPILVDSGTIQQRAKQLLTRIRYRQSPTKMLIVFLSSVVFLLFEVSAESGVDSSDRCAPYRTHTRGICATTYNGDGSTAKNIASALYTQQIAWKSKDLVATPIVQGFRKDFDGNEAFIKDAINTSLPIIVSECSVHSFTILPPNTTELVFHDTRLMWNMRITSVKPVGASKPLQGSGDLTGNQQYFDAFFIARPIGGYGGRIDAKFFDYTNSKHIYQSMNKVYSSGKYFEPATVINRGRILQYTVTCNKTSLSPTDFEVALQVYRSSQLESKMVVHPAENVTVKNKHKIEWIKAPRPLNASDVVKAVIALKAIDRKDCMGETFLYKKCGTYNLATFMPVLGTILILLIIALVTGFLVWKRKAYLPIPTTAVAWSKFAWLAFASAEREKHRNARSVGDAEDVSIDEDIAAGMKSGGNVIDAEFCLVDDEYGQQALTIRRRVSS